MVWIFTFFLSKSYLSFNFAAETGKLATVAYKAPVPNQLLEANMNVVTLNQIGKTYYLDGFEVLAA